VRQVKLAKPAPSCSVPLVSDKYCYFVLYVPARCFSYGLLFYSYPLQVDDIYFILYIHPDRFSRERSTLHVQSLTCYFDENNNLSDYCR